MQKLTKHILMILGLLLFMSSQSMGQSKWVPIMMDDMMVMVPYGQPSVKVAKDYYAPNATVTVNVQGELSGDKDWVGIYRKGTSTAWSNVLAWNWASKNGTVSLIKDKKSIPAGEYEARLFFHNNYEMKASDSFVVRKAPISTLKTSYKVNETVSVNVQMALSGVKDWVGIYPKNSTDWADVIAWAWVEKNGVVTLTIDQKPMPAGEYEIRLFYKNSLDKIEARYAFSVGGGNNNYEYGSGVPINEIDNVVGYENETDHPDYFVYYPKKHIQGAPLVLMSAHTGVHGYRGLMKYLASKGCYVVGHADRILPPKKNREYWWDVMFRIKHFEPAVKHAHDIGVDTSRIITIGSSAGGMVSYPIMKHFKEKGYASKNSIIIDIQGWYAQNMTKTQLQNLNTHSLVIALGGYTGEQGKMTQDPRVLLTLSKLMQRDKSFKVIKTDNHGYASGVYKDIIKKKNELLAPIDEMIKYEFFNNNGKYNSAKSLLFDDYDKNVQKVYTKTMEYIDDKGGDWDESYDSYRKAYKDYGCVKDKDGHSYEPTIDYCNDHGL